MINNLIVLGSALLLTILVEFIVLCTSKVNINVDSIFALLISNVITNPVLNIVLLMILGTTFLLYVIIGEILVVIIEALIYKAILKIDIHSALVLSAKLNIVSYMVGELIKIVF